MALKQVANAEKPNPKHVLSVPHVTIFDLRASLKLNVSQCMCVCVCVCVFFFFFFVPEGGAAEYFEFQLST